MSFTSSTRLLPFGRTLIPLDRLPLADKFSALQRTLLALDDMSRFQYAVLASIVLHAIVFMGLYVLLDLRHFGTPYAAVAGQATANAVVGVVAFQLVELLPGAMERRKAQRSRLRR